MYPIADQCTHAALDHYYTMYLCFDPMQEVFDSGFCINKGYSR